MPLIDVHPDMTAATAQLKRIADCLVELLRAAYNIHMEPVKADLSTARDKEEIAYSDDHETLRQDLLDVDRGRDPFRPVDVDEPDV